MNKAEEIRLSAQLRQLEHSLYEVDTQEEIQRIRFEIEFVKRKLNELRSSLYGRGAAL